MNLHNEDFVIPNELEHYETRYMHCVGELVQQHYQSTITDTQNGVQRKTNLNDTYRCLSTEDSHVSRFDEDPPHTHRMFDAMKTIEDASSSCTDNEHLISVYNVCIDCCSDCLEYFAMLYFSFRVVVFCLSNIHG